MCTSSGPIHILCTFIIPTYPTSRYVFVHGHTTLHYIPQQMPQPDITTFHIPVAFTSDFAYGHLIEDGESIPNSWLSIVAKGNPPATQEG